MTNDFKEKLLKWLVGKYNVEDGQDLPNYSTITEKINNLYDDLSQILANEYGTFNFVGFVQNYSTNTNVNNINIIYGYSTNNRHKNWYGWIALINEDFKLIKLIDEFDTGVILGKLDFLGIDNENNLYAIEQMYENTNIIRLITLNNVTIKLPNQDYKLKIKKSYYISEATNNQFDRIYTIAIKHPNKNTFFLAGTDTTSTPVFVGTELIDNGQGSPTFNYYKSTTTGVVKDAWANWNSSDVLDFRILATDYDSNILILDKNNSSISNSTYSLPTDNVGYLDKVDAKILSKENIYATGFNILSDNSKRVYYIYKFFNNNFKKIYSKDGTYKDYDRNDTSTIKITITNNEVFFHSIMYSDTNYNVEFGRIVDDKIYSTSIDNVIINDSYGLSFFAVNKQFNLYNFYLQIQNNVYNCYQIYNSNNYNGNSYQDLNSLIPNYGNLYKDDKLIYSRNLYNLVINDNSTTSTIEIPNTMLNDSIINGEKLIGKTNGELVDNNLEISKNIYELLYINFINSIIIQNNNNNTLVNNIIASSVLNKSISNTLDYDNVKLTKYRINFIDNTVMISRLSISNINEKKYLISFLIYFTKDINSIELISEDEQTIYLTIDGSNLEKEKYYIIKQNVEVV